MAGQHHRPVTSRHRLLRWIVPAATGVALIAVGAALLAHPSAYRQHARATANQLVHRLRAEQIAAARPATHCTAPAPSDPANGQRARMILTIPKLGLTAPVVAGTTDRALDAGVGHIDASTWPDQGGTTVLAAHNVTFFSHLPRLPRGAEIRLSTACRDWTYRVSAWRVVPAGTPVAATTRPRLVLVTCWPADALFYTSQRYVVTADLQRTSAIGRVRSATAGLPAIHAAVLTKADLSATHLGLPLGRLHLDDRLDRTWLQSNRPLQTSDDTVELLGSAVRAAGRHRLGWWHTIAPTVPFPTGGPLTGASPIWRSPADITVTGADATVRGTRITVRVAAGGTVRQLVMVTAVRQGRMTITGWRLHRLPHPPAHHRGRPR